MKKITKYIEISKIILKDVDVDNIYNCPFFISSDCGVDKCCAMKDFRKKIGCKIQFKNDGALHETFENCPLVSPFYRAFEIEVNN